MKPPLVTIILPVFNAMPYLEACIQSLLGQTLSDFQLLIFDDASTDGSLAHIQDIADPRIELVASSENKGYVHHLNQGLDMASGRYIARMDADDICHPDRLLRQVEFLEKNPAYDVCGTWVQPIGQVDHTEIWELPSDHEEIIIHHFFYNTALAHPSVMFRKAWIDRHQVRYDASFMPAEDYELWTRLSGGTKFKNMAMPLLSYRQHASQISQRQAQKKNEALFVIRKMQLSLLIDKPNDTQLFVSNSISNEDYQSLGKEIKTVSSFLSELYVTNKVKSVFDHKLFNHELGYIWWMTCTTTARSGGREIIRLYHSNDICKFYVPSFFSNIKFHLKAWLNL